MKRLLRTGLLGGLCGILAPTAVAEPWQEADDPPTRGAADLLWERNREVLHEGNPLELAGLDQGDEGFRARTPGLLRSDRAAALVDRDENYRRRLALYDSQASYHHPLPLATPSENRARTSRRSEAARPLDAEAESSRGAGWWGGFLAFLALACLALLVARRSLSRSGSPRA